jgi:hypothetical protein
MHDTRFSFRKSTKEVCSLYWVFCLCNRAVKMKGSGDMWGLWRRRKRQILHGNWTSSSSPSQTSMSACAGIARSTALNLNHWLLQLNPIYVSTYAYSAIIERALLQGHWTDRYGKEHRV